MSLFQCEVCGCCENTALSSQGCKGFFEQVFDWTGFEDRRGKLLCSACGPTKHSDGMETGLGKWHGKFRQVFLPMGEFHTAQNGNLENIKTGDQDFQKYEIPVNEERNS